MITSTKNKTRNLLLATTAVVTLGMASPAFAQGVGTGAWVSVEGGMAAMTTGYSNYSYDVGFTGPYSYTMPDTGANLAFEIGVDIPNTPYSVGVGLRSSSVGSGYYGYLYGYESEEASYQTMDFEVGRDMALGGIGNGRLTLGVRNASINTTDTYSYHGSYQSSGSFNGTGPRVALETSIPVFNNVSLDLEAGAAILFGETTSFYSGGHHGGGSSSSTTTVTDLDFSAALSYLIGSNSKASLGYRIEQFSGLEMYTFGYVDTLTDQGAFLKFTTGF